MHKWSCPYSPLASGAGISADFVAADAVVLLKKDSLIMWWELIIGRIIQRLLTLEDWCKERRFEG